MTDGQPVTARKEHRQWRALGRRFDGASICSEPHGIFTFRQAWPTLCGLYYFKVTKQKSVIFVH